MTITILRKALLLSFTCLAIGALVPQTSYATDPTNPPIDQPTTKPGKFSKLREFLGSCLGCIKATEDVIEEVLPENTNEVEQVVNKNNTNSTIKGQAAVAVEDQEKVKNMTKKISKKSKKNRRQAADDIPSDIPEKSASNSCWGGFCSKKSKA